MQSQNTKSKKSNQELLQFRRVAPVRKRRPEASEDKPRDPVPDSLSIDALIKKLRGSFKGKPSLVEALLRERRNDERAKTRKFKAMYRELNTKC
jgi:hypothetical protein